MKTFRYIFGLMVLLALMLSNPALSYSAPQDSVRRVLPSSLPQGEQVIFFEDFNPQNGKIDSSKWSLCPKRPPHWARFLSESYDEAYIHDGALRLVAHKSKDGYKVGGIHTKGKFYFRYGRVEVCARFSRQAQGAWPAIWMMPEYPHYPNATWPTSGEIDIMELLNHDTFIYQTIHSHYHNILGNKKPQKTDTLSYHADEYNVYALEWTPDYLSIQVNGIEGLRYPNLHLIDDADKKQWPYDAPFYLILNIALGGEDTWPGKINDRELPAYMDIDWVRVSQKESPKSR